LDLEGRFRPGYYLLRVIEAALWGDHVLLWYAARFALAGATIAGVIALAWRLPWPALVALALIPFAGPQAEAWYRLGPQEAYALPLLVWGLALVGRWPGVGLLLAAGLVKESFAVVLPLIAAWAWWRDRWTPQVIVLAVGALLLCAAVALTQAGGDFYGDVRTVASVWRVAGELAVPFVVCLVPAAVGLLYAPRRVALALAGGVALLASQAVVYGGFTDPLPGRYLAIVSIGAVLVAAAGFRHMPSRPVPLAAVPLLILGASTMWVQHDRAEWWAGSSRDFQRSLSIIAIHDGPLVVTGADQYPEAALSVTRYLAGPRPTGACAEIMFIEGVGTGICPMVYVVRGIP
jgi:hypothetical protein